MRGYSKEEPYERGEARESLIITAAIAPSPLFPEAGNASSSVEATIETASACSGAGASIIHLDDSFDWSVEDWGRAVKGMRKRCSAILEVDISRRPRGERLTILGLHPDIASVPLGYQSLVFTESEIDAPHSVTAIEETLTLCEKNEVKPQLEVWHSGSIWRLNDIIAKRLVLPPYFLGVYLGWPGGNWSPPSVEELLYRFRLLPDGSVCTISVAGKEQTALLGLALGLGGHLRVGTRDNPYVKDGVLARDNAQLVEQVARLGAASGRKPATPAEARRMIGISPQ